MRLRSTLAGLLQHTSHASVDAVLRRTALLLLLLTIIPFSPQCLFNNSILVEYFKGPREQVPALPNNSLSSCFVTLLKSVWNNRLESSIRPVEFKEALGHMHPQFRDFRQHDCQEFLALLLGTLHDQLNSAACRHGRALRRDSIMDCQPAGPGAEDAATLAESDQLSTATLQTDALSIAHASLAPETEPDSCVGSGTISPKSTDSSASSTVSSVNDHYVDRMAQPLPDNVKSFSLPDDSSNLIAVENLTAARGSQQLGKTPEKNELYALSAGLARVATDCALSKELTVEDLLAKSTKISNTNVLVEEKKTNNEINFDSSKYPRARDRNQTSELVDNFRNPFACLAAEDGEIDEQLKAESKLTTSAKKRLKQTNIRASHTSVHQTQSSEADSTEVHMSEADVDGGQPQKRMKVESVDSGMDKNSAGSGSTAREAGFEDEGTHEWLAYLAENKSVVVDTFQGQFKSTVTCSSCRHVSVTYEPFMYLPVPLPHALEKQLVITYVSAPPGYGCGNPPVRYLVTVHKHDRIDKVAAQLREMLSEEGAQLSPSVGLVFAEVRDCCIVKMLDINSPLRYLGNDTSIFVFEMPEMICLPDQGASVDAETYFLPPTPGSAVPDGSPSYNAMEFAYPSPNKESAEAFDAADVPSQSPLHDDGFDEGNSLDKPPTPNVSPIKGLSDDSWNVDDKMRSPSLKQFEGEQDNAIANWCTEFSFGPQLPNDQATSQCCVCLDNLPVDDLVIHPDPCTCVICHSCLDGHYKHNANKESDTFACPTCSQTVKKADYVAVNHKEELFAQAPK